MSLMHFFLTAAILLGSASAEEWRWMGGAELNASPHGIVDIGWRSSSWSVQLLTETLDVRYQQELSRGKLWAAARLELGAAGLISGPWTDGAPDPTRAMWASYAGAEGGWQRYLPRGLYGGFEGLVRQFWFDEQKQTLALADPQLLMMGQAVLGYYRPDIQIRISAGAQVTPGGDAPVAPQLVAQGRYLPSWTLAPRLELYAGLAENQGFLSTTRLGGLNPYVVPLAGAGWAEWWVEDYAALRLGPIVQGGGWSSGVLIDAAWFDGQTAIGLGLPLRRQWERFFIDTAFGYAPWIERQDQIGRWGALVLVGQGWG